MPGSGTTGGMPDTPSVPFVSDFQLTAALYAISPMASVSIRKTTPRARTASHPVGTATSAETPAAMRSWRIPMSVSRVATIAAV